MNVPCFRLLLASLITVSALAANREAAAATILIEATPTVTWRSGGMESGGENAPLIIQATAGDVLEIRVVGGPHGFVTIDKPGNQSPSSAVKLVQACGESAQDKPDAVFREIECSRFNMRLIANMKLEVLPAFQNDVNFWCVIHQSGMWGTIKRTP
jgi:hypothetical protein